MHFISFHSNPTQFRTITIKGFHFSRNRCFVELHKQYNYKHCFVFPFSFQPQTICSIESLCRLVITREDDITHTVSIYMQPDRLVSFMMEDRDALEFTLVLVGYHLLLTGKCQSYTL